MRPLWSFIAQFPTSEKSQQYRILAQVWLDLTWWNTLLSQFNGIFYFNENIQDIFQLYKDVSLKGLGDFFYNNSIKPWTNDKINQSKPFLAQTSNCAITSTPRMTIDLEELVSINIFEV